MAASNALLSLESGRRLPGIVLEAVAYTDVVAVQVAERFDVVVSQVTVTTTPRGGGRTHAANPQYGDAQGEMATIRPGSCDLVTSMARRASVAGVGSMTYRDANLCTAGPRSQREFPGTAGEHTGSMKSRERVRGGHDPRVAARYPGEHR